VALGKAYLDRASKFSKMAEENLGEVMAARTMAMNAGAPKYFAPEFSKLDVQLRESTRDIEIGKLADAIENRSQMQVQYLDLELRAIKYAQVNQAQVVIAQALKEGAAEFAPRTLAVAQKNVDDTSAYITSNRHDTNEVNARGAMTLASAQHLLKITHDAKVSDKATPEDLALRLEKDKATVTSQQGQLDRGAKANAELLSEKELAQRFEKARSQFTESEAEVYKKGNTMVIRLRGLEFPTAQATIKESNFPLLAKVQSVIEDIGPGTVIVEGHTDSIGGKAINDKVSAERASAVKAYLISNSKIQDTEITAVGYGFQKPLGTNKTKQGRAQNRRVDILIKPTAAAQAM
jgi:OmpA-OmpF porin, OOP family